MEGSWKSEAARVWGQHRRRVADLYAGRPVERPVAIRGRMLGRSHGLWGTNEIDMIAEPEAWLADAVADARIHAGEALDPRTFRPLVIEIDAFGTHYIDALFGAPVRFHEGQVWSEPLGVGLAGLPPPDLSRNALFQASLRLARLAVEASEGILFVASPVLSCPINIGVNLFSDRLLAAFIEAPEDARHALDVIAGTIRRCIRAFAGVIPADLRLTSVGSERYAPPGYGFIDGCATQLVSGRSYRDFLAPLDASLLNEWPRGGMIHLCGGHIQHIPAWAGMAEVRSVQLNDRAADDLEHYARELRTDQVLYVSPTESTPVERILEVARRRPVILQADLPDGFYP